MQQSQGLDFASKLLKKYGWAEGKGLGREESGISEALKPKLKFDSTGFGHDQAEEFKFSWWDHNLNKALNNITVSTSQEGSIQLKKKSELQVSKKKPSAAINKAKLYGAFVKGGTLHGNEEEKDDSESSNSEEERDYSHTMSDSDLFRICGGRTAHKGARHGLTMSAKLARLEEQEQKLLQKWSDKGISSQEEVTKKKKKKKSKQTLEGTVNALDYEESKQTVDGTTNALGCEDNESKVPERKKKRKKKNGLEDMHEENGIDHRLSKSDEENMSDRTEELLQGEIPRVEDVEENGAGEKEKKKKKKKKEKKEKNKYFNENEVHEHLLEDQIENGDNRKEKIKEHKQRTIDIGSTNSSCETEKLTEIKTKEKKKKKSSKRNKEESETVEVNGTATNEIEKKAKKKKKRKLQIEEERDEEMENIAPQEIISKKKHKKKNKSVV